METPFNPRLSHRSGSVDILSDPYVVQHFNCYIPDKDDASNLHAVPRRLLQNSVPLRRQSETPAEAVSRRQARRAVVSTPLLGLEIDNKINGCPEHDNYFNASYRESGLKKLKSGSWESIVRWEKENELLFAFIEDECEWLSELFPEERIDPTHFFQALQDGVVLIKLAQLCQNYAESYSKMNDMKIPFFTIHIHSHEKCSGRMGNFLSRENVELFLKWCRAHKIHESLLFESNDVVEKNEKEGLRDGAREIVLCLMEVARYGVRFGVKPPKLILLEKEIEYEEEMENSIDGSISPKSGDSGVDTELDNFNLSYLGDVSYTESRSSSSNCENLENYKNSYKNSQKTQNVNNEDSNSFNDIKDNELHDARGIYNQRSSSVTKRFSDIQETKEIGSDDMLNECGVDDDASSHDHDHHDRSHNHDHHDHSHDLDHHDRSHDHDHHDRSHDHDHHDRSHDHDHDHKHNHDHDHDTSRTSINGHDNEDGVFDEDNVNNEFSTNESTTSDSSSVCKSERKRRSFGGSGRKYSQEILTNQGKNDNDKLRRRSSVNVNKSELHKIVTSIVENYNIQKITRVKEGKYIILGKVMFVRLLNKHCIVRIGGGWDTLEHYLMTHVNKVAAGSLEIEANPFTPSPLQSKRTRKKAQYSSTPNLLSVELTSGRDSPAFDRSISPHVRKDPYLQQKVNKQRDDKLITEAISRVQADIIANHPRPTSALEKIHFEVRRRVSPVPYNCQSNMANLDAVPFDYNANLVKDENDVQNGQYEYGQVDNSKDTEDGVHENGFHDNGVLVNGVHENGIANGVNGNGCHTNGEQKEPSENIDDDGIVETTTVTEVTNIIIPADETGNTGSQISSSKVVSSTKKTKVSVDDKKKMKTSKSASNIKDGSKSMKPSSKSSSALASRPTAATKTSTTRTVSKSVAPNKTTIKKTTTTTTKTNAPKTTDTKPTAHKHPAGTRPTSSKPLSARPISARPTTTKPTSATKKPTSSTDKPATKPTTTKTSASRPPTTKSPTRPPTTRPPTTKATAPKTAATKTTAPKSATTTRPAATKTTVSKLPSSKPATAKPAPKTTGSKTTIEKKTASTSSKVIKSKDTVTEVKKVTSEKVKSVKTSETSTVKKAKSPSGISTRPSTGKTASRITPSATKTKPASAGAKTDLKPKTKTIPGRVPSGTTGKRPSTKSKTDDKPKPIKKIVKKEEPVVVVDEQCKPDIKPEEPAVTPTDDKADLIINLTLEESTPEPVSPFSPHSDISETNIHNASIVESVDTSIEIVESSVTHKEDELITNDAVEEHFQPSEEHLNESSENDKSFEVINDSMHEVETELNNLQLNESCESKEVESVTPSQEDLSIESTDDNKLNEDSNESSQPTGDDTRDNELESNFEMIEHHDVEESNYITEPHKEVENDNQVPVTAVSKYADLQSFETSEHIDNSNKDVATENNENDNDKSAECVPEEPSLEGIVPSEKETLNEVTHETHEVQHAIDVKTDEPEANQVPSNEEIEENKTEEASHFHAESSESYHEDNQQSFDNEQEYSSPYLNRESELFCVTPLDRGLESDDAVTPFENSSPESSPAKDTLVSLDLTLDKAEERAYDVETPMSDIAVCGTDEGSDQVLSSMEELSQEEDNRYHDGMQGDSYYSSNIEKEENEFDQGHPETECHEEFKEGEDQLHQEIKLDDQSNQEVKTDDQSNQEVKTDYQSFEDHSQQPSEWMKEDNQFHEEVKQDDHLHQEVEKDDHLHQEVKEDDHLHQEVEKDDHLPQESKEDDHLHQEAKEDDHLHQEVKEDVQEITEDNQLHQEVKGDDQSHQDMNVESEQSHQDMNVESEQSHTEYMTDDVQAHFEVAKPNYFDDFVDNSVKNNEEDNQVELIEPHHHAEDIFNKVETEDSTSNHVDDSIGESGRNDETAPFQYDESQKFDIGQDAHHEDVTSESQNHSINDNVHDGMEEIGMNRTDEQMTIDCREEIEVKTVWEQSTADAHEQKESYEQDNHTVHETNEDTAQHNYDEFSEQTNGSNGILFMKRINGSDIESSDESEDPSSPNHHVMLNQSKISMTTTTTSSHTEYESMHVESEGTWQAVEVSSTSYSDETSKFYDDFSSDQHALTSSENLG